MPMLDYRCRNRLQRARSSMPNPHQAVRRAAVLFSLRSVFTKPGRRRATRRGDQVGPAGFVGQ